MSAYVQGYDNCGKLSKRFIYFEIVRVDLIILSSVSLQTVCALVQSNILIQILLVYWQYKWSAILFISIGSDIVDIVVIAMKKTFYLTSNCARTQKMA